MVTVPVAPQTAEEAAVLLSAAHFDRRPVVIVAGGSRAHWWPAIEDALGQCDPLAVSTLGLLATEDIHAANLTATFCAGSRLSLVQEHLAAEGLWLPLTNLDSADATLGGCVAAGFVSPFLLGFGPSRDWVLGLEVVSPQGNVLSLGGELVKNVAGYDLVHVHTGAWGRLGLICRVTVRLLPLPETAALAVQECSVGPADAARLEEQLCAALSGKARPTALEVSLSSAGEGHMWAGFVGSQASVLTRAESLGWDAVSATTGPETLWDSYRRERHAAAVGLPWRARVSVPAPGLERLVAVLRAAIGTERWYLCGHAGSGVYHVYWRDDSGPYRVLEGIRRELAGGAGGGFVVAEGEAAAVRERAPDWVGFLPHPRRSQDALDAALVRALCDDLPLNPHLVVAPVLAGRGVRQ